MNFKDYLLDTAPKINTCLEATKKGFIDDVSLVSAHLPPLIELLFNACDGGKKIRATMVRIGYELFTNSINKDIYTAGLSFEIFHSSILIHDDIIDKSDLRRGNSTIHNILGNNHYAKSQAICLGDVGFFLAYRLLTKTCFSPERTVKAIQLFSDTLLSTTLGEILDVMLPILTNKNEDDLLAIMKNKTAYYTIANPLCLGALLAGAEEKNLNTLKEFGEYVGVALQIKDDINGVFSELTEIGKSNTSDIEEGKLTYLYIFAQNNCTREQKILLNKFYGTGKIDDQVHIIQQLFIETGARDYAYNMLNKNIKKAKSVASRFTGTRRDLLFSIADYMQEYK